jgi:6-pyruvoyltetrahydropterin/6-carboxytetrahydropterin synthase
MVIRKLFKYEMGHIVRNAWSQRCSKSFHGHSYTVELCFESDNLDNGGMVSDFGFLKKVFHPFVDSFDHASVIWNREEDVHIVNFFLTNFDRVISTTFSSTAELQAAMFYYFGKKAITYMNSNDIFVNGERGVKMHSARVHETTTGWAEFGLFDEVISNKLEEVVDTKNILFSKGVQDEWPAEFATFYHSLPPYEQA